MAPHKSITAEHIVRRVAERYATCESYADRGRHECIHNPDEPPSGRQYEVLHFETRFRRPDRFYFEFVTEAPGPRESWRRYVIWQAGAQCRVWWSIQDMEEVDELKMAIGAAAGVSGGTTYAIPPLLLPEMFGNKGFATTMGIVNPDSYERLDDADIEGHMHWCIRPAPGITRGVPDLIFIDPDTLLVRRITGRADLGPQWRAEILDHARAALPPDHVSLMELAFREVPDHHTSTDTTDYNAAFDVQLDDDAFHFEPD